MKIIKIWILCCLPLLSVVSCKKFLDVSASNVVLEDDLFKDGSGIRVAVNGVYRLLSTEELYAKNLSFGFTSIISYNYDNNFIPTELAGASNFSWNNANIQTITESIWSSAYNTLANCNNIIKHLKDKDSSAFISGMNEKNLILGEMYGIRGLLHFELLRLFSAAPISGHTGATIPYVDSYPSHQPAFLNMHDILEKIDQDLTTAQELLAPIDTILLRSLYRSSAFRIRDPMGSVSIPQGDFFGYRAQRMSFFGATALLARFNLYRNNHTEAERNARIIYNFQRTGSFYTWTPPINQGLINSPDYLYPKKPDEIILSFSNNNQLTTYSNNIGNGNTLISFYRMNAAYLNKLFEGDMDDFRYIGLYNKNNDLRYGTWARPAVASVLSNRISDRQGPILPVIRFSECLHILAECLITRGELSEATQILSTIRTNRGAKAPVSGSLSDINLMEMVYKDFIRETLTEGQAFYLHKRLSRNISNGTTERTMNSNDWYAPIPASETDYQFSK